MKPLPLLIAAVILSAAAGALAATLVASGDPEEPRSDGTAALQLELDRLGRELELLRRQDEARAAALEALRREEVLSSPGGDRESLRTVDDAVAQWMEENRGTLAALLEEDGAVPGDAGAEPAPAERSIDEVLAMLQDPDMDQLERELLWEELRKEGRLDELVAIFEERAERDPHNPDVQVQLGEVYLRKTMDAGGGPMAGQWATKADEAFDRALEIDEQHWDARFSKAISLSFWPPVFGKQGEAIHQFQVLIGQQEQKPPQEGFEQSYLLLGNIYQQSGDMEKAVETWKQGLVAFPENSDLMGQVALAEAQGD